MSYRTYSQYFRHGYASPAKDKIPLAELINGYIDAMWQTHDKLSICDFDPVIHVTPKQYAEIKKMMPTNMSKFKVFEDEPTVVEHQGQDGIWREVGP